MPLVLTFAYGKHKGSHIAETDRLATRACAKWRVSVAKPGGAMRKKGSGVP